jgi:hypothetical protein
MIVEMVACVEAIEAAIWNIEEPDPTRKVLSDTD